MSATVHDADQPPVVVSEFERAVEDFLRSNAAVRSEDHFEWGVGPEHLTIFHDTAGEAEQHEVDEAKAWQATRWANGFGWIWGPREHGGGGLPRSVERLYQQLEAHFEIPDMSPLRVGLGTVSPGIVAHGTPDQIARFAAPLHRGETLACQLFSEPDAGSDLANVRTKAVRDGPSWVLSGQKVWSSNAHLADIGFALARSDPDGPKHRSLTMFVVPMSSAGIVVHPLRQITGGASFTELFFDETVVDDSCRIGEPGEGWRVAMTALGAERTSVGDRSHTMTARALALLRELARREEHVPAPARHHLVDLELRLRVARYHQARMQAIPVDQLSGSERVLDKLMLSGNLRRMGEIAGELLGVRMVADSGEWGMYGWSSWVLGATGMRIGGGTDEVLKNLVAERLLGLPREPT